VDLLTGMRVATEVARLGNFNEASRYLRLSPASVSRIVAELEEHLGVRLFNRTTRHCSLTEAGQDFVSRSTGLLEEISALRDAIRERQEAPHGTLRISCVAAFASECLAPALPRFLLQYPQLSVTVDVGNRLVDLIGEHYDVAIRLAPLRDSRMISQKIFTQRILVVAAPSLCELYGTPQSLEDLKALPSVTQISGEWGRVQQFRHARRIIDFNVPQHVTMTSAQAVKNTCLTGYGYSLLPDFMVAEEIKRGRLVQLLPDYEPMDRPIHALFAERRYSPQKIRVFVDFLVGAFSSSRVRQS
jgi:LysR family transcriptional regulator for bpeEF and oprC